MRDDVSCWSCSCLSSAACLPPSRPAIRRCHSIPPSPQVSPRFSLPYVSSPPSVEQGAHFTSAIDWPWIDSLGLQIRFHLGVDGISLWLILLTTLLVPIAVWMTGRMVADRQKDFCALLAAIRIRLDRRLFSARPVRLLLLLGSRSCAHVPVGRVVGRRAPWTGGRQILCLHDARLRADACSILYLHSLTGTFDYVDIINGLILAA